MAELNVAATGLIFAFLGVGSLMGALLCKPISDRFGIGKATLFTAVLGASGSPFVLLATGHTFLDIVLLSVGQLLFGFGTTCYINATALRQYITPAELQGKVIAKIRFLTWGINPIGSLLGGFLGGSIGLIGALSISSVGFFFAVDSLFFSQMYRMHTLASVDLAKNVD